MKLKAKFTDTKTGTDSKLDALKYALEFDENSEEGECLGYISSFSGSYSSTTSENIDYIDYVSRNYVYGKVVKDNRKSSKTMEDFLEKYSALKPEQIEPLRKIERVLLENSVLRESKRIHFITSNRHEHSNKKLIELENWYEDRFEDLIICFKRGELYVNLRKNHKGELDYYASDFYRGYSFPAIYRKQSAEELFYLTEKLSEAEKSSGMVFRNALTAGLLFGGLEIMNYATSDTFFPPLLTGAVGIWAGVAFTYAKITVDLRRSRLAAGINAIKPVSEGERALEKLCDLYLK